jgi:hypothetical protein
MPPASDPHAVPAYRARLIDEIVRAVGLDPSGFGRRILGPLFRIPAGRFARVIARADEAIRSSGLPGGASSVLHDLGLEPVVWGAGQVPVEGPLIVASNHPGAYDSLALMASIPRPDLKVVISDVGLSRTFEAGSKHFIFALKTAAGRAKAMRESLRHLEAGGALLIYPHTEVEPDPETSPGAAEALGEWSRSLELMVRRVPATRLQVAIASGILLPRFIRSPLVRVRRDPAKRQKMAEFLQVSWQMVFPRRVRPRIHLSFAAPAGAGELAAEGIMPAVLRISRRLLESHLAAVRETA